MNARSVFAMVCSAAALGASSAMAVPVLNTVVTFNGANGSDPLAGFTADSTGNLYGTTYSGGNAAGTSGGSVFEIAAGTGAFSTLGTFSGSQGDGIHNGVIVDPSGNIYGTALFGGGTGADGTVFSIPAGTNTVNALVTFTGLNGAYSQAGLIRDSMGDLFGVTQQGGTSGYGTVFEVSAGTNALTTLVNFNSTNGDGPVARLIADAAGDLYGTTFRGGSNNNGTVFEVAAGSNALTTLVTFNSSNGFPEAGLIADPSGNLYGTTEGGSAAPDGTIFKIAAGTGALTTLALFNGADGQAPFASLIRDNAGDLFGTTFSGGSAGDGTVYELANGSSSITPLVSFTGINGDAPQGSLYADAQGNLFGTTSAGGSDNDGTVFEITGSGFAVPEPSSLSLAVMGGIALLKRRSRRSMR